MSHWFLSTNSWKQTASRVGGGSTPSVSDVNFPTMDTLRHPTQVWPGFDKKLNFLPRANKARAAQVQLLFVCDFWQWGSFRNRAGEVKAQWRQGSESFTSSADHKDSRGLLLQTKNYREKMCQSQCFECKLGFISYYSFALILKRGKQGGWKRPHTKGRWALLINSHVCYQSFVKPFGVWTDETEKPDKCIKWQV